MALVAVMSGWVGVLLIGYSWWTSLLGLVCLAVAGDICFALLCVPVCPYCQAGLEPEENWDWKFCPYCHERIKTCGARLIFTRGHW